jgi:hypothetical protein
MLSMYAWMLDLCVCLDVCWMLYVTYVWMHGRMDVICDISIAICDISIDIWMDLYVTYLHRVDICARDV